MRSFTAALGLLTAVPIGRKEVEGLTLGRSVGWFPAVGALIGSMVGGVVWLTGEVFTGLVPATTGVVFGLLVTRGLHEDGLADTADGFGGGWTVDRRLAIMKDSRLGTYGTLALIVSVLMRVGLIAAIPRDDMVLVLIATHALARAGSVLMMLVLHPASQEGLGASYLEASSRPVLVAGVLSAVAIAGLCLGWGSVVAVAAVAGAVVAVGLLAKRKVGGFTGDVLGATEQVGEIAVLLAAV